MLSKKGKKLKGFIISLLSLIIAGQCFGVASSAAYNAQTAVSYANTYANSHNSNFYYFGDDVDCTNFVSQCVAVGGVVSYVDPNFTSTPIITRKYINNSNPDVWYMIKKERLIGFDYYEYSNSWSTVSSFKTFHKNHEGSVKQFKISDSNVIDNIARNLHIGDVVQVDGVHSVIITKCQVNLLLVNPTYEDYTIEYAGHSNKAKNESFDTFINWWFLYHSSKSLNIISF